MVFARLLRPGRLCEVEGARTGVELRTWARESVGVVGEGSKEGTLAFRVCESDLARLCGSDLVRVCDWNESRGGSRMYDFDSYWNPMVADGLSVVAVGDCFESGDCLEVGEDVRVGGDGCAVVVAVARLLLLAGLTKLLGLFTGSFISLAPVPQEGLACVGDAGLPTEPLFRSFFSTSGLTAVDVGTPDEVGVAGVVGVGGYVVELER